MIESQEEKNSKKRLIKAILITGLIAGTFDIAAAIIQTLINERQVTAMLKFIASGVFGQEALSGGSFYAYCGLFFHYCIATGWSALFYFIYPRVKFFSRNWIVTGLIYGFFVWIMMNRIVLPLSNTPSIPFKLRWNLVKSMLIIITAIGLPISFRVKKYFS